jgi:hypothetical protein
MAFSGINFRATSGYVTDNAADTYSLGEAYPTTRGGKTFGFGSSITSNTRDRSTGVDVRLAGIAFMANSGSPTNFTIDLASGTYKVRLALGDAAAPQVIYCQLKDGATVRATIGPTTTSGPTRWLDATGAELIDSAWPSSNATVTIVVSSGALTVALGGSSGGSGIAAISHVAWELQAASGPTITVQPSNQTVTAGATAAFGVTATSSGGALSYQWQRSINSGGSWSNVSTGTGGTSASYTTAATTVSGGSANNGDQYRCNVTDTNGTTATSAASLTVNAAAPVLISATGTATGNTTGIGSVSTTGADGVIWGKRAASAQTDPGGGLEAANGWTSQAVSASGVQNFTFTGLTTNTAVVANYFHVNAGGLRSPVATSAARCRRRAARPAAPSPMPARPQRARSRCRVSDPVPGT